MCNFFSFVSDGMGKTYYFDWDTRKDILKSRNFEPDSHTSIATYFGLNEDRLNKYEYNFLTKEFKVDQINAADDSSIVERWVSKLDPKKIVAPFIVKAIINPLKLKPKKVSKEDIECLNQWASVGDSVWDIVWASVRASVRTSVGASVWDSVRTSVWDSVRASVRTNVGASVWDSVGASVWDSFLGYLSSFFDIEYKYDFSPIIKLWERGFVPSFDGKTWRLHAGPKAKVVYERK